MIEKALQNGEKNLLKNGQKSSPKMNRNVPRDDPPNLLKIDQKSLRARAKTFLAAIKKPP